VRGRGFVGALERSWSGAPGSIPWSLALLPLAGPYAIGSAWARGAAARTRSAAAGVHVVAVGNLTVGGTGKSSIARWLAGEVAEAGGRGAVLLRGHGASAAGDVPAAVPDFAGLPPARGAARYGDEALAHRAALPRSIAVIVDPDRSRAASSARRGYGATVAILDDGWEQRRLAWNELWVTLDASRPCGNGALVPAGPLRRPPETLASATVVAFLLESEEERVSGEASALIARHAPRAAVLRFRRTLLGLSALGDPRVTPWPAGSGACGLLTAVGAPARVERFVRAAGIPVASHEAFPDHAAASPPRLRASLERLRAGGASVALVTEKDEHRWIFPDPAPLPVLVLRTGVQPLDPVSAHLASIRGAAGGVC
jgi:tetraacyldisaccharide 4'-kinase